MASNIALIPSNSKNRRVPISTRERFDILRRDRFCCQYCGARAADTVLHVDHIKSVANGGTNDASNLITACWPCNIGKGSRSGSDPRRAHFRVTVVPDCLDPFWKSEPKAVQSALDIRDLLFFKFCPYGPHNIRNKFLEDAKANEADDLESILQCTYIYGLSVHQIFQLIVAAQSFRHFFRILRRWRRSVDRGDFHSEWFWRAEG